MFELILIIGTLSAFAIMCVYDFRSAPENAREGKYGREMIRLGGFFAVAFILLFSALFFLILK